MKFLAKVFGYSSAKPAKSQIPTISANQSKIDAPEHNYDLKKQLLRVSVTLKELSKKNEARNSEISYSGTATETTANSPFLTSTNSPCLTDSSASPMNSSNSGPSDHSRVNLTELHLLTHEPHPNSFLRNKTNSYEHKRREISSYSVFSPSRPPSTSGRISESDSTGMGSPSPRPVNVAVGSPSSRERAYSGASRPSSCNIIYLHSPPHSPLRNTPKALSSVFAAERNNVDKMTPETPQSSLITASTDDCTDNEDNTTTDTTTDDRNSFSLENFHISELKSPRSPDRVMVASKSESYESNGSGSPDSQIRKLSRLQELKLLDKNFSEENQQDESYPIQRQNVAVNIPVMITPLELDANFSSSTKNFSASEKNILMAKKLLEQQKLKNDLEEQSLSSKDKEDMEEKKQQSGKQLKHYSALYKNQYMVTKTVGGNVLSEKRTPRVDCSPRGVSPLGGQVLHTSNKIKQIS